MVRTQIQLTKEQASALKRLAVERGVSMAELIRQAVERMLEEDTLDDRWRRALSVVGHYQGGPSDVSTDHDKYLDEAYSAWTSSSTPQRSTPS